MTSRQLPGSLPNAIKAFGQNALPLVLRATPFIGETAAELAQRIIDLSEQAQHNKEVFKDIRERLTISLLDISEHAPGGDISPQQEAYKKTLKEILLYVNEINKTNDAHSKSIIKKVMKYIDAKNTSEAYEKITRKLDLATNRFYNSVILDGHAKISEVNENLKELVQLTLLEKGASLTNEEIGELRIDPRKFKDCGHSSISRGKIQKRKYKGDDVAVKNWGTVPLEAVAKEVKIVKLLSTWGPIERLIGLYFENVNREDCLFLVTEWMEDGNLHEYLNNNKLIPWTTKLQIAEQVAKGLAYCNDKKVFHRDVRSKNVLLNIKDGKLYAKLTNFHRSRKIFDEFSHGLVFETYRWTAPEKLKYQDRYNEKCEVYSFATTLWEISAHKFPFFEVTDDWEVREKIQRGERPSPFAKDTPEPYKRLVEDAWHQDPEKRPKIDDIHEKLNEMI